MIAALTTPSPKKEGNTLDESLVTGLEPLRQLAATCLEQSGRTNLPKEVRNTLLLASRYLRELTPDEDEYHCRDWTTKVEIIHSPSCGPLLSFDAIHQAGPNYGGYSCALRDLPYILVGDIAAKFDWKEVADELTRELENYRKKESCP